MHIVEAGVGDETIKNLLDPGMFDRIIIDWSVLKFIPRDGINLPGETLASFAQTYLKMHGHWFIRDLTRTYPPLDETTTYKESDKRMTLGHNGRRYELYLQPGWTNQHYRQHFNLLPKYVRFTPELSDDDVWYEKMEDNVVIFTIDTFGVEMQDEWIDPLRRRSFECKEIDPELYPLQNERSHNDDPGLMFDCELGGARSNHGARTGGVQETEGCHDTEGPC